MSPEVMPATCTDRKSGSAGMPRPRSTLFPYTALFRSHARAPVAQAARAQRREVVLPGVCAADVAGGDAGHVHRSEERFSRNAETEIYTLSLHGALPISRPRSSSSGGPRAAA